MLNRYVLLFHGVVVVVIVWKLDVQLPVQPVSTTTNLVSSRPAHGEVYSIQHYSNGQFLINFSSFCISLMVNFSLILVHSVYSNG